MKNHPLVRLRETRVLAAKNGVAAPVNFGFWDDPELMTVDGDVFEIYFSDMIDDWFGISAAMVVEALANAGGRDVLIHLNSPGGMYTEGLAIHSAIKQYAGKVTFRIAGMAASAASFIMLAGDHVEITEGSLVMIHDAHDYGGGPAHEHRKTADLLDKVSDAIAGMYAGKASGEPADWRALMVEETWYAGQEAVDAGLVDVLADVEPAPANSTPRTVAATQWASIFASAPKATGGKIAPGTVNYPFAETGIAASVVALQGVDVAALQAEVDRLRAERDTPPVEPVPPEPTPQPEPNPAPVLSIVDSLQGVDLSALLRDALLTKGAR